MATQMQKPLPTGQLDPVTFEIIKGAIQSTRVEMESLIERTAMSPVIKEKKDYFASIFDCNGRLVTATSLPLGSNLMECILEEFPLEAMKPGDIFWYNDCYLSRGGVSHFPDMVFASPVFFEGKIIAFSATFGHFIDIGGIAVTSMSGNSVEAYQEGIMVPPIKICEGGKLNEAVMKVFLRNTRFPDIMRGDIRAVQAGCLLGVRRLTDIAGRFGPTALCSAFAQMMAQSATAARKAYMALPDGTYTFTEHVDADPQTGGSPSVQVSLVKEQGRVIIDTTGSSDQAKGCINFLMHEGVPATMYGTYFIAQDPTLLVNYGLREAVDEVRVREGSILRPRFPAPLAFRTVTMLRVHQAIMGTLALATKGKTSAATPSYVIMAIRTADPVTNKPVAVQDALAVGFGARPTADGLDAIYYIAQKNFPAEFMELEHPVDICCYGLGIDSGGPGRWRGGAGIVKEIRLKSSQGQLMVRMDNVKFPPWGVNGGMGGRAGRVILNPGTDREVVLPPISDGAILKAGDVLRIETCGGGGWGHPFDRVPDLVRQDALNGIVSLEGAHRDYGVVFSPDTFEIDPEATAHHRTHHRPETKMFHRTDYFDA